VSYAELKLFAQNPALRARTPPDVNLGLHLYIDGAPISAVAIDARKAGTYSIDYVVTGPSGLTGTSTRTVIVSPPANDNTPATTTDATSSTH
jgi:hypothetical protein